jgi:hypothetical protein
MGEYGIGRVPRDVDPVREIAAEIAAAEIVAGMLHRQSRPAGRPRLTCRHCGQGGYAGAYPFSTYAAGDPPACDDCGETGGGMGW